MLPKELKPQQNDIKNLIRVGHKFDGGYVIDKRTVQYTKNILAFGLGDEWSFEKEYLKLNKSCNIFVYDHTVNGRFWRNRLFKDIIDFLKLKKLRLRKILNIFKYFQYKIFFNKKNIHYIKKIVSKSENTNEASLDQAFNDLDDVLLKIDIEGDEYKIINDIKKYEKKISCLIIEFINKH